MLPNPQNPNKDKHSGLQSYSHYSGLAFQMIAIILAFVWAGKKIDEKYFPGRSVFIIVLSLIGVFIAMYVVLKDFLKISKKK
jgi:F0F1-type ATP synthase assembly protein I